MEGNTNCDPLLDSSPTDNQGPAGTDKHEHAKDHKAAAPPADQRSQHAPFADYLRDEVAAGYMYCLVQSIAQGETLSPDAFAIYRNRFLKEAENPTDPVEIQLLEQLAMAHLAIGRLHIRACAEVNARQSIAFSDAATRLLAELRRCSLALEEYRTKQLERKERKATVSPKEPPAAANGEQLPSTNGDVPRNGHAVDIGRMARSEPRGKQKNSRDKQWSNSHREVPECLRNRIAPQIPSALRPAAAIGRNSKG